MHGRYQVFRDKQKKTDRQRNWQEKYSKQAEQLKI